MAARRRLFDRTVFDHGQPLARASSLPAAILFISLLAAILPLQGPRPHALLIDLPVGNALGATFEEWPADIPIHRLVVTQSDEMLWDDQAIETLQLFAMVEALTNESPRPGLVFAPESNASYELSVKVLNVLTGMGATDDRFCLGGLAQHRHFGRDRPTPILLLTSMMPSGEGLEPGVPLTPAQCVSPSG